MDEIVKLRAGVEHADAVRPEHARASRADAPRQRLLALAPRGAGLAEARGDDDERPRARCKRLVDGCLEVQLGHHDHRELGVVDARRATTREHARRLLPRGG